MFSLPFVFAVPATCAYTHDESQALARVIRAALALAGHNQKSAAAVMGISESQLCRLIASGTLAPTFRRLGATFWAAFVRLTVEDVAERRTA